MINDVTVMDFTGVYEQETFYKNENFTWIDCTDINGDNCYCDLDALTKIKLIINDFYPSGIHFIDSGNYHYITKLWTDKINEPFDLILFDHHTDMQPSLFDNLLSCGCWVKNVIDTNKYLNKVIIIGANEQLFKAVERKYDNRVIFYGEHLLNTNDLWKSLKYKQIKLPVYISVDKDVLNTKSAATNWDQGSFSLSELKYFLKTIMINDKIIGIDVCGESMNNINIVEQNRILKLNNETNSSLIKLLKSEY